MKVGILAGGVGTRLAEETAIKPFTEFVFVDNFWHSG